MGGPFCDHFLAESDWCVFIMSNLADNKITGVSPCNYKLQWNLHLFDSIKLKISRAQISEQVKPVWKPSTAERWLILACSKMKRGMTPRPGSMHRWMKADRNGSSRTCGQPSSRRGWSAASRTSPSISPASRTYTWCTPTSGTTPEYTPCSRAAG